MQTEQVQVEITETVINDSKLWRIIHSRDILPRETDLLRTSWGFHLGTCQRILDGSHNS